MLRNISMIKANTSTRLQKTISGESTAWMLYSVAWVATLLLSMPLYSITLLILPCIKKILDIWMFFFMQTFLLDYSYIFSPRSNLGPASLSCSLKIKHLGTTSICSIATSQNFFDVCNWAFYTIVGVTFKFAPLLMKT